MKRETKEWIRTAEMDWESALDPSAAESRSHKVLHDKICFHSAFRQIESSSVGKGEAILTPLRPTLFHRLPGSVGGEGARSMTPDIPDGEGLMVEFKSDRGRLSDRDLVANVVCLTNTEGGQL